jgi:Pvc16 N-terminal domain
MVGQILELLQRTLNDFLGSKGLGTDQVVISDIRDHDGRVVLAKDKIALVLINIVQEKMISTPPDRGTSPNAAHTDPALHTNLFVLFFANFQGEHYVQGLNMISETISCFQQTPVITRAKAPDLPLSIDRLALEYTNLNFSELADVMRMLGANYLPSVCYKVRTLPFASGQS